jgi:integrase
MRPRHGKNLFRFMDTTGKPLGIAGVGQRVRRLARDAGVRLTFKSLRRGFGCRYAGKVSAHVLQRLMRHSDLKITMTYYANIDTAVEEAVLGAKRNTSRNREVPGILVSNGLIDAKDSQETGNDGS